MKEKLKLIPKQQPADATSKETLSDNQHKLDDAEPGEARIHAELAELIEAAEGTKNKELMAWVNSHCTECDQCYNIFFAWQAAFEQFRKLKSRDQKADRMILKNYVEKYIKSAISNTRWLSDWLNEGLIYSNVFNIAAADEIRIGFVQDRCRIFSFKNIQADQDILYLPGANFKCVIRASNIGLEVEALFTEPCLMLLFKLPRDCQDSLKLVDAREFLRKTNVKSSLFTPGENYVAILQGRGERNV